MSKVTATVRMSGLLVLVRHTTGAHGQSTTSKEPMTVLLPASPHDMSGEHHNHFEHLTLLRVHRDVLLNPKTAVGPNITGMSPHDSHDQKDPYVSFDLSGWQVHLPRSEKRDPVGHVPDNPWSDQVPGADESFDPQSLNNLADLQTLTGGKFDLATLAQPAPPTVAARVLLSGGDLYAVPAEAPLDSSYFEFFWTNTIRVQHLVESLDHSFDTDDDGTIEIGLSRLNDPKPVVYRWRLSVEGVAAPPVVISNRPPSTPETLTNCVMNPTATLDHVSLYYPLMGNPGSKPFVRFLGMRAGRNPIESRLGSTLAHRTGDPGCLCGGAYVFVADQS